MIYKYSFLNSIAYLKKYNKCIFLKIFSYFKKGGGFIFYKTYLDYDILNSIKFFIFYFNIDFSFYNFYLNILPENIIKYDNCLDLSLFFSIFFSFFKLNFNINTLILGIINLKTGKILEVGNIFLKIRLILKNNIDLLIISNENKYFSFLNNNVLILKFNYLNEVYEFFKRCLTQRQSFAITKHSSGVRFS